MGGLAEVMTTAQAAEYLRVSVAKVRRLARAGVLSAAKIGERAWRFRKADLDEWLAAGGTRYEDLIAQSLAHEAERILADPNAEWTPLEQVRKELGL